MEHAVQGQSGLFPVIKGLLGSGTKGVCAAAAVNRPLVT